MGVVTIDTHKPVKELTAADFDERQAEAVVGIVVEAINTELVTEKALNSALEPIRNTLAKHSLLLTLIVGGIVALIVKAYVGA